MTDVRANEYDIKAAGYTQSGVSAVAKSTETKAPNSVNTVENVGENTDSISKGNSDNSSQTAAKRSLEEVYNSIASLCSKYGISLSKAKEFGLMGKISGKSEDKLLNIENNELQKYVRCLEEALKKLSQNGNKIELEELAQKANDYNIAISTGWTIEEFEKRQRSSKESVLERIHRVYPNKSDKEALELYIKNYMLTTPKELAAAKTEEERQRIIKHKTKLQLQDFGRLLINSSPEEKMLIKEIVKNLYAENRIPGWKNFMASLSLDDQMEVADSMTLEDKRIMAQEDVFGNRPSTEQNLELNASITEHQSDNGIKNSHKELIEEANKFYVENKEALDNINKKIADAEAEKGSKLTSEELQKLLTKEEFSLYYQDKSFYTAMQAGEMVGTSVNCNITDEVRNQIIEVMNKDASELQNYRAVLEELGEFVENHPELTTVNGQNIRDYLNEHTNGNLETVINDNKNSTSTELKSDKTKPSNETLNNNDTNNYVNNIHTINHSTTDDKNTKENKLNSYTSISEAIVKDGYKGFIQYTKQVGVVAAIIETFSNLSSIHDSGTIRLATRRYEDRKDKQEDILHSVGTTAIGMLLAHTSNETYAKLDGETFGSFYATSLVNDAVEDMKKRKGC